MLQEDAVFTRHRFRIFKYNKNIEFCESHGKKKMDKATEPLSSAVAFIAKQLKHIMRVLGTAAIIDSSADAEEAF